VGRGSAKDAFHRPFAGLAKEAAPAPRSVPEKAPVAARAVLPPPAAAAMPEDLFLAEVGDARPLTARGGRVGAPAAGTRRPGAAARRSEDAEVLAALADLCAGEGAFDIADSDEYIEGTAEGIDRRLLKRLRAGDFAVQAHVDLHGLHRDEARARVTRFVADSRRAGHRCVLIVHGRGLHSKDQIPVLKQAVRSWLERGQLARAVLAFASARPCDGGAGAVYALLRR